MQKRLLFKIDYVCKIPWRGSRVIFGRQSISNVLTFERRLNMTEILWFRLLNPNGSCHGYCRGRPRLVLVNRLEGLSLPRNSATINWPARHDLVVDWAVKLQHKQTKPLLGSLSNLQVKRTGIKARMNSNLGRIGLFTLELLPLSADIFCHLLIMEKMMSLRFLCYCEFNLHQTYR